MSEFPEGGRAVIIGASGGIGAAVEAELSEDRRFAEVVGLARDRSPPMDLTNEASIEAAARSLKASGGDIRLIFVATGYLHGDGFAPEKSWRRLTPEGLARSFQANAIGPALLMKHFLPLLPKAGKSLFAALSARVGSIGDNDLGGWYGYRASKAALNQLIRTAAIELARARPDAACVALHPGTVATRLSEPFAKSGLHVRPPAEAARDLLSVVDRLSAKDTGRFFDHAGTPIPW